MFTVKIPYPVGSYLYVRETFYQYGEWVYGDIKVDKIDGVDIYKTKYHFSADNTKPIYFIDTLPTDIKPCKRVDGKGYYKRPSLFMPKNASRITLTVKGVTLERLHEITDEGAKAEGVKDRAEYYRIWKELNGEESWAVNPWVWVVKFDVREVRK